MSTGNYQTKTDQPVKVDVFHFDDYATIEELIVWVGEEADPYVFGDDEGIAITIPTPDHSANQTALLGDWIVKGREGGHYVIKNEVFVERYELSSAAPIPAGESVINQLPADDLTTDEASGPRISFNEETDVMQEVIELAPATLEPTIFPNETSEIDSGAATVVVEQPEVVDVEELPEDLSAPNEIIIDGELVVEEQPEGDEERPAEQTV
jgi:hypothetical protein